MSKDGRGEGGHLASFIRSTHVACAPTGCRSLRQALRTHCEHSSQVPAFTELTLGGGHKIQAGVPPVHLSVMKEVKQGN